MIRLQEIREYSFEDGTTLYVRLDREAGTVDFVERTPGKMAMTPAEWRPTNFKFAGRTKKYMNGWLNIFEAMKFVINDVKKEFAEWDDKNAKDFLELMQMLDKDKE